MRRKDREIRDPEELRRVLETGDACRIALVDDGEPYVVTMNYGLVWDYDDTPILYFHCANEGRKLDIIRKKADACCVVDVDHELTGGSSACSWGMKFASVVGRGKMEFVQDPEERVRALDAIMRHYTDRSFDGYDERVFAATEILRLRLVELTGKRRT